MSAVEDYREVAARIKADSVYDEHRGMGMMCSPIAHECQEKADAAIAELEVEKQVLFNGMAAAVNEVEWLLLQWAARAEKGGGE